MSARQPEPGQTQPEPGRLALIAEATKRAGLIWITVPDAAIPGGAGGGATGRPHPVWHVWRDVAYVLTGPGEPGPAGFGRVVRDYRRAAVVARADRIVLPGVGHMVQNAAPELVEHEIDAMIGRNHISATN